ncbi:MAG: hypothetical protein AAF235_02370 [Planctomycetota bacterium]
MRQSRSIRSSTGADQSISFEGRGGDRGLRGIAFWGGNIYLAASAEVHVFDMSFQKIGTLSSPYLLHCHEIDIRGDHLYTTSTAYDTILRFDLRTGKADWAVCFRRGTIEPPAKPAGLAKMRLRVAARLSRDESALLRSASRFLKDPEKTAARAKPIHAFPFDPNSKPGSPGTPAQADTLHFNNVRVHGSSVEFSGLRTNRIMGYDEDSETLSEVAVIPVGTHNAQRTTIDGEERFIYSHTRSDAVEIADGRGNPLESFHIPPLTRADYDVPDGDEGIARPGFDRGLCFAENGKLLVGGSSPTTIAVYRRGEGMLKFMRLSRDVRNAAHGLEIWPA